MSDPKEYAIGWICAITTEYTAAKQFLDEVHDEPSTLSANDNNAYTLGRIGKHNVVIAVLPDGEYGLSSAARVAGSLLHSFPNVKVGLMVGIGGGAPSSMHDIRLGDVVVSSPRDGKGGVFQYDFGKTLQDKAFQQTGFLNQPPEALRAAVVQLKSQYESEGHEFEDTINAILEAKKKLRRNYKCPGPSNDRLYQSTFVHKADGENCEAACGNELAHLVSRPQRDEDDDDPAVHYGLIASANNLMKDALVRDKLSAEMDVLCFEMEAAGLMNHFPCLVIRGICDYADSHKNKDWQGYAAMTAAAYAKDLLKVLPLSKVEKEKKVLDILSDINTNTSKTESHVANMSSSLNSWKDREILDWLTKHDYGPQQSDHLSRRQPGTGTWFLQSTRYKDWRDSDGNGQILFCSGMPGAGKTIMASIVIEDITDRCLVDSTLGLAYVFCDFRLKDEQSVEHLLASILKQLAQRKSSLPESVGLLFKNHDRTRTRPSLDELSKSIQSVMATYRTAFLIIDALDECHKINECQKIFISHLLDILKGSKSKMLATSRPIPEIAERFEGDKLKIYAHRNDVEIYLHGRISQSGSELLNLHKKEITIRISESVDGMFLLAQLHFDTIKSKRTLKQIKNVLSTLSSGFEGYTQAYDDAMKRIKAQDPDASKLAMDTLRWITRARIQLSTHELREALAVEPGTRELDQENIPRVNDMVSVCAGLVTFDGLRIRLVHYTTQDYFERNWYSWFADAESILAMTCLTYLCFDVFDCGPCQTRKEFENRLRHHAFFEYSAQNWEFHANRTQIESSDLIYRFLNSDRKVAASLQVLLKGHGPNFDDWARENFLYPSCEADSWSNGGNISPRNDIWEGGRQNYGNEHEDVVDAEVPSSFPISDRSTEPLWQISLAKLDGFTGLHLAANIGLTEAVDFLLSSGQNPDVTDSEGLTPLVWALSRDHISLAQLLLDKGANLEHKIDYGQRTPLSWAVRYGPMDAIQLLLKNGANLESQDESGQTPLSWAIEEDSVGIIELLIENGASLDPQDKSGRTPLSRAIRDRGTVEWLLENGANLESQDESGRTPLFWAIKEGSLGVIELLIERGANLQSRDKSGRTLLSPAIGDRDAIEWLLENGADLESQDESGRTPLFWAVEEGSTSTIEFLLHNGANLESRDESGRTPLSWAVKGRSIYNIELTLDSLEAQDVIEDELKFYDLPLPWAVGDGIIDSIKVLLENGADLESRDESGRTPLSWAAEESSPSTIEFLLEKGANLESRDESGCTPLFWAFLAEKRDSARLLLGYGADMNTRDGLGRSLLDCGIDMEKELCMDPGWTDLSRMSSFCKIPWLETDASGDGSADTIKSSFASMDPFSHQSLESFQVGLSPGIGASRYVDYLISTENSWTLSLRRS